MSKEIDSLSELKTFAEEFLREHPHGAVVGLSGPLGAGKTTLVRLIIEILAAKNNQTAPAVRSPSFVLHQSYPEIKPPIEHFDFYRLENISVPDLATLGYEEAVERARAHKGFVFVEWPEKAAKMDSLMLDRMLTIGLSGDSRTIL